MDTVTKDVDSPGYGGARLLVLMSGAPLAAMVQLAILPSLTQMANHFSDQGAGVLDGPVIAQLVMTIAAPTMVVGAPLIGWLAERAGKRPVLLMSALIYAISGVAGAFAPDIWTLFATRLVLGLASAGFDTVSLGLIGGYYVRERRDRLIGWHSLLGSGGALVTLVAAGGLAELDWRAPFGLYIIGLVVFLVALPAIKEPKRAEIVAGVAGEGSVRTASGLFLLTVLISIVMYMASIQGPFLLASRGIRSPSIQALVADVTTIGAMLGAYLFGHLRPRMSFAAILVLLWTALGLGTIGLGMAGGLAILVFFAALSGFGGGFMAPLTQSTILNVVPASAATRAMGLSFGCIFLGQFLHPFVMAPLRSAVGIQTTFVCVGVAALAAATLTVIWHLSGGWPGHARRRPQPL